MQKNNQHKGCILASIQELLNKRYISSYKEIISKLYTVDM
jgi:hypothetical protein